MDVALDPRAIAAACALLAGACTAKAPDVPDPGSGIDAGAAFADVVLAYAPTGGVPETCGGSLAVCGEIEPCGPTDVLGPPDTVKVDLTNGELVLGFICSTIVEHGTELPELRIWGEGSFVVEGSQDSQEYEVWGSSAGANPTFDLTTVDLPYVKYVRITGNGSIDAVEALSDASVDPSPFDAGPGADAATFDAAL